MNSNGFYRSKGNKFGIVIYIGFYVLLLLTSVSLSGCGGNDNVDLAEPEGKEVAQTGDFTTITDLDADYYIDYENGTIPLGDLPIGTRVVDPSWKWEYRLGVNYSDIDWEGASTPPGEIKPVTWIVVAKYHYDGLEPHVTLLSEELIGLFTFDDSTGRGHEVRVYDEPSDGYNHWGESGTTNARHGLRLWLNSTGIHSGEGFYQAFSDDFKGVLLTTTVPNKEWQNGSAYSTSDDVFVPSTTELGYNSYNGYIRTYPIGSVYSYFDGAGDEERVARLSEDALWYWTRSPNSDNALSVLGFSASGLISGDASCNRYNGVRLALNLKSDTLVSEIRN